MSGDILVFLTGKEEIMNAVNTLDEYNLKNSTDKYVFIPFYPIYLILNVQNFHHSLFGSYEKCRFSILTKLHFLIFLI